MGCGASKRAAPVTPVFDSGEILECSSASLWNNNRARIENLDGFAVDQEHPNESGESGKVSSVTNGTSSVSTGRSSTSTGSRLLGNLHRYIEGEAVAAGWPQWLSAVAGEAVQGWVPLKADSFEKLEKIGQGTYSSVFKARDLETGRVVALKKVRFDNMDPDSVRFMAREILILRRLNHPNIIKLEGLIASRLSCNIYLVFEYMEHDLAGLTSSPDIKFSESQVKCYMHQLLSGIEHCHSLGIMHRDIKCANVLVSNEGVLKVADFGLANFFNPNRKHAMTSRVVTLWYRPPELLLGSTDYEASVDLWSVGCVFAEMFAGKPILQGRTEVEQIHKIFKLCGSPPDEYWRKSAQSHATVFKPPQPYESRLRETFKSLQDSTFDLLETLLSVDRHKRGSASTALNSEYFKTRPYACDPSSLPKYTPNREIDAKFREDARKRRVSNLEASRRMTRTNNTTTIQESITHKHKASYPEESLFTRKDSGRRNLNPDMPHLRRASGESNRLFVDLHPLPAIQRPEGEIPFSGPAIIAAPNGFAWASKKSKEESSSLSKNQTWSGARKHASGSAELAMSNSKPHDVARQAILKQWAHMEARDSFKSRVLVPQNYHDKKDRVEFSGPLISQSRKVDELLMKNEQHIRQAVRRPWFQKGNKQRR